MQTRCDMIAVYIARPAEKSWEFLQLRRRAEDYLGATWSTVYGMIEQAETAWQAALRELGEETGIVTSEFYRVPTVRSFYTEPNDTLWHVPAFCAVVRRDVQVRLNEEHTALRWAPRDRVDGMFLWPTDREAIGEIVDEILAPDSPSRVYLRIDLPQS